MYAFIYFLYNIFLLINLLMIYFNYFGELILKSVLSLKIYIWKNALFSVTFLIFKIFVKHTIP